MRPKLAEGRFKGGFMFLIVICQKMSPKSAGGRLKGVLCFWFKFVKMSSKSAEGR